MSAYHPITPARLDWREGQPASDQFGDIYFNSDGGLEESRYVFLQANDLPRRWRDKRAFVIAETGFGTGLNLLATLALWRQSAPAGARLHFISVEKHPLSHADLRRALEAWPQLQDLSAELLACYPPLSHGYHARTLLGGRVNLTLMLGDALEMFGGLQARVDCWFLDGFAPGKNPAMWRPELLRHIARLSAPGASFSTFTAAGAVRRGLQAVGFEVDKQPGFGRKREMIRGRFTGHTASTSACPWFDLGHRDATREKQATVIGAGLAGCTTAHALARRGWRVTLIERRETIASEASGNHSGVVLPRLSADMSPAGRFYLSAFLHASHFFDRLKQRAPQLSWQRSGVVQQLSEEVLARLTALQLPEDVLTPLDTATASQRAGTALTSHAALYPLGGWLSPPRLCAQLLELAGERVELVTAREALRLERDGHNWRLSDATSLITESPVVVLANGSEARRFAPRSLALTPVRGQLAYLASTPASEQLHTPVCFDGYLIPAYRGRHSAGATYAPGDDSTELRSEDQRAILTMLERALPQLPPLEVSGGRVAFRCASPDHLPLIGPVADDDFYLQAYAGLKHGKPPRHFPPARYRPGLFVSSGHGSRGLVSCPLAAELIAAMIEGEPLPLPQDLLNALHPARFLVRRLRRGQ